VLSGHLIDIIEEVSSVGGFNTRSVEFVESKPQFNDQDLAHEAEMAKVARAHQRGRYLTGETKFNAYWKTLIAGAYQPEEEADLRADFELKNRIAKIVRFFGMWYMQKMSGSLVLIIIYALAMFLFGGLYKKETRERMTGTGKFANSPRFWTRHAFIDRRMMRSKVGFIGLVPRLAIPGDRICVFEGGKVPLILRPNGVLWELIGDSYIHGIMMGEAFEQERCIKYTLI